MRKYIPSKLHNKKVFIPLLVLVVLIVIVLFSRSSGSAQVETQTIKRQDLVQSLSASGNVDSLQTVNLTFGMGGKLVYLGVKKGDTVHAGQVIATLDQRVMQKNLETSLRTYAQERNTFDQTKDDKHASTPNDAVNDQIKRILQNNQYDLEKSVISVELQSLAKEQSVLTTPISGIVTRADVESSGINVGLTTTFTVANPSDLVFQMDVDEADIGKISEGMPVKMIMSAYPDETLYLTVDSIDFATHTTSTGGNVYTIEARMPNTETNKYRIGMTGDAEIIVQKKDNVVTVPLTSVTDDNYVYVKTKDGFVKKKVALGLSNDTDAEVVSGLEVNDQVALDPVQAEKMKPKKFLIF